MTLELLFMYVTMRFLLCVYFNGQNSIARDCFAGPGYKYSLQLGFNQWPHMVKSIQYSILWPTVVIEVDTPTGGSFQDRKEGGSLYSSMSLLPGAIQ